MPPSAAAATRSAPSPTSPGLPWRVGWGASSPMRRRGARAARPHASSKVVNAATGACSRAFALRGPTTTLSAGAPSGLCAVVLAAEHLAAHLDADTLLAGAAEELAEDDADASGEGAAVVALEAGENADGVVLSGWAIGAAIDAAAVATRATEACGAAAADVEEIVVRTPVEGARGLGGMLALGRAVAAVRRGAGARR